jgi:tyrosinase
MAFRMLQRVTGLLILLILNFWGLSANSSYIRTKHKRHLVDEIMIVHREEANAAPFVSVLGIRGLGSDTIHPRLEIRELERRPDEFNVFLLGLRRFQRVSQDNKLSYFQVAGKETSFTK